MSTKSTTLKRPIMTPNQITLLRFVLTLVLFGVWLCVPLSWLQKAVICVVFAAIFILDNIDGIIARKYTLTSLSGHYFDAAVDVVTYFCLAFMLHAEGIVPLYFIALMLIREILVVYIKAYLAETGKHVATSPLAVVKCELIGVPFALLYIIFSGDSLTQYMTITMVLVYFTTLRLWYTITGRQQLLLLVTAVIPLLLYPAVRHFLSIAEWYLYSYMTIAALFSYVSALGYFNLMWSER